MITLLLIEPVPLDPFNFQPETSIGESLLLYSSTNSSLAPFGPRVRNSLITKRSNGLGDGDGDGEGVAVGLGDGLAVGVGLGDGVGVGLGEGVGVGVGVTTLTIAGSDWAPRAVAMIADWPTSIPVILPLLSMRTTPSLLDRQLKITPSSS